MSKCSTFVYGYDESDYDPRALPRCPKCKGFLPKDFPLGKPFKCNKCGAKLETIPNTESLEDEDKELDDSEVYEHYGGKICEIPNTIGDN